MTSPLRRKRPTTARAPTSTPRPTAPDSPPRARAPWPLALLAGLLASASAPAQAPSRASPYPTWPAPVAQTTPAPAPAPAPDLPPRPLPAAVASPPTAPPAAEAPEPLAPAAYQPARSPARGEGGLGEGGPEDERATAIQVQPPGILRWSRLDSDARLQARIRVEHRALGIAEPVVFPEEPILSRDTYSGRGPIWPQRAVIVEPNFVCYDRLHFQELNSERYGWDLDILNPFVSAGAFYFDLALLPYHKFTDPCRCHDCNTGYCLPGDPVPYLLYPQGLSVSGAVAEIGTILALVAIFP